MEDLSEDQIAAYVTEIRDVDAQFGPVNDKPHEVLAVKLTSVQECRVEVGPKGFKPVIWLNFMAEDRLLKLAIDRRDLSRIVACLENSEAAKIQS